MQNIRDSQLFLQVQEDVLDSLVPQQQLLVIALDLCGFPAGDVSVNEGEDLVLSPQVSALCELRILFEESNIFPNLNRAPGSFSFFSCFWWLPLSSWAGNFRRISFNDDEWVHMSVY